MSAASDFLTAFARSLSTLSLYEDGHPALDRVLAESHEKLQLLQEEAPTPSFTFLGGEVLLGRRPVRDLRAWSWSTRLSNVGVQRVEMDGPVGREDLDAFIHEVYERVNGDGGSTAEVRTARPTQIRYGSAQLKGSDEGSVPVTAAAAVATLGYDLQAELGAMDWVHDELKEGRQLPMLEAESVVRSLTVAMHGSQEFILPLLRLKEFDQYTTAHTLNVSTLSMALADYVGLSSSQVTAIGVAGLLHDIGKVTVPDEILNKPGRLTDEERQVMNGHTTEGAKIILESDDHLDLAAVVAYEHHIKLDGGGYPTFTYPRRCHEASDLVHVCDIFDALRTHRPYREAWDEERVLGYIEEGAGTEFDPELARAFVQLIRTTGERITEIEARDQKIEAPAQAAAAVGLEPPSESMSEGV